MTASSRLILLLFVLFCALPGTGCKNKSRTRIDVHDIENYSAYKWLDSTIFPFTSDGSISSRTFKLEKGKYTMHLKGYGTRGENRAPTLDLQIGPYPPMRITIGLQESTQDINFELPEEMEGKIIFTFSDDYYTATEDRNAYIIFPIIIDRF
jgi:hypothetical protein